MAGRRGRQVLVACLNLGLALCPGAPSIAQEPQLPPPAKAPYAAAEVLPIDLPTALRLVNANNPTIAFAQARVQEALARQEQAQVLFLPNLTLGSIYQRLDGQIQNSNGTVFTTSRGSTFQAGGPELRVDTADALFGPLVAQRLTQAERENARAVTHNTQLSAASAYLDLVFAYENLAINADTLAKARQMLDRARAADKAGLIKTKGDVPRAETEVSLRRQERFELEARAAVASARLTRLLFLNPAVTLKPADPAVVPLVLVPPAQSLEDLLMVAVANRPELAANRSVALAAQERLRQARLGPLLPKLQIDYLAGGFGGGRNQRIADYDGRGELNAQAFWEFRNLGFGNRGQVRERQALVDQAQFRVLEVQAQVTDEVVEAAKIAAARFAALDAAREAVKQATELYRRLLESSFGMIGPRAQYDALEPLLAIQALNQAQTRYLEDVIEFNRAQFQLYTALGRPPEAAFVDKTSVPLHAVMHSLQSQTLGSNGLGSPIRP